MFLIEPQTATGGLGRGVAPGAIDNVVSLIQRTYPGAKVIGDDVVRVAPEVDLKLIEVAYCHSFFPEGVEKLRQALRIPVLARR